MLAGMCCYAGTALVKSIRSVPGMQLCMPTPFKGHIRRLRLQGPPPLYQIIRTHNTHTHAHIHTHILSAHEPPAVPTPLMASSTSLDHTMADTASTTMAGQERAQRGRSFTAASCVARSPITDFEGTEA